MRPCAAAPLNKTAIRYLRNIPVLKVGPRAQFHELFAQVRYPHFYADAEAREEPAWGCGLALFNRIGFGVFGDNFENKTFP
jgi:hypothetical protein